MMGTVRQLFRVLRPALFAASATAIFVLGPPVFAQSEDSGALATSVRARVVVSDRRAAATALTDWAESEGGYFVLRSFDHVELRLPDSAGSALREVLSRIALDVLSYNPSAQDLRQELVQVEAGITSRRESLDRILAFLDSADVAATLAFEQELSGILRELEQLAGRRRVLAHRIAHTYISIALSSQDQEIPSQIPSSFDWINSMGLYRFLREVPR